MKIMNISAMKAGRENVKQWENNLPHCLFVCLFVIGRGIPDMSPQNAVSLVAL
jgi:hypothetical protein